MDTRDTLGLLGTQALRARDSLNGPLLGPLPDNQWQLEVQHWHATSMAYMQATFLQPILGLKNPDMARVMYVRYPNTNY